MNDGKEFEVKRWLLHILMSLVLILQLSFFGWLVWITYFRPIVRASQISRASIDEFEEIVYAPQEKIRGHFHNTDDTINMEKQNRSLCLKCHGTYPHSKAKAVRAFLNAHSFFIACEVCHIRRKDGEVFSYKWIKTDTDTELRYLQGKPGNYGAVITPFIKKGDGALKRLDRTIDDRMILNYLKLRETLTADQAAEIKLKIHKRISNKPVFCDECHRKDGYIDFRKLLYSPKRVATLTSTEVVGVIKKYKKFYFPTMFDPQALMMEHEGGQVFPKQDQ